MILMFPQWNTILTYKKGTVFTHFLSPSFPSISLWVSLPPSCVWVKELLRETCFEFNLSAAFTGRSAYLSQPNTAMSFPSCTGFRSIVAPGFKGAHGQDSAATLSLHSQDSDCFLLQALKSVWCCNSLSLTFKASSLFPIHFKTYEATIDF